MSETLNLEGLSFSIHRSPRRRTIGITVDRDGDLAVAIPDKGDMARVEKTVRKKLFWVFTKLAEKSLLFQPIPEKEYVSGEGFCYLGRSYRLLLVNDTVEDGAAPLRLAHGRFIMHRQDQSKAATLFTRWYTDHARQWINRRVQEFVTRTGKQPKQVRVLDLGNRWGSCSTEGGLNFHWRTIRLPPSLVEYVVVHELVHLIEPRHDRAFWSRLERVMPDYRERKRRLSIQGASY
jgi:predicted metal-dependent hydrolase